MMASAAPSMRRLVTGGHGDAAHPGGVRRGDAPRRVFDGHTLRRAQPRAPTVERADGLQERIGRRLAVADILRADHRRKPLTHAAALENGLDLVAERSGRNGQRAVPVQASQGFCNAGIERRRLGELRKARALARQQRVDVSGVRRLPFAPTHGRQTLAVRQAEKMLEVFGGRQLQTDVRQHGAIRRAVQRLGIGKHAVEVEDQRGHRGREDHDPLDTPKPACVSRLIMPADDSPATILLVDDEEVVVRSVAALLELETPHTIVTETSPRRAIELAKVRPLDMIISDFLMPEIDGIRLLLEIRGLYPESALILLTGYADKENAIRAINEAGIFHYMEKPWDNDDLLTIIRTGLDKRLQLHRMHERIRELEGRVQHLQRRTTELEAKLKGQD